MRPARARQIDAQNPQLLGQHLACAALELPLLLEGDQAFFGARMPAVANELRSAGALALLPCFASMGRQLPIQHVLQMSRALKHVSSARTCVCSSVFAFVTPLVAAHA